MRVPKSLGNPLEHRIKVEKDVVIPEAEHSIAVVRQTRGAHVVCAPLRSMLATVQFDHKLRINTAEVGNVEVDRVLASELRAGELPMSNPRPEGPLGVGLFAAEDLGVSA